MNLKLNPRDRTPIYGQIVQQIKCLIASGDLSPGQQLPTVRTLAEQLKVNINTIARAYDLLDKDGVISTQQGRGTYVAAWMDDVHIQQHRREALQAAINHTLLEALSLGYTADEIEQAFSRSLKEWRRTRTTTSRRDR